MAGKKRSQVQDAPMSKTAKASLAKKGKQEGFIPAAPENLDRVYSLGGGEYVRILDPRTGKTHHLRAISPSYDAIVSELLTHPSHGAAIRRELMDKGFSIPE